MKVKMSKVPLLDADNYQPNSTWWQFCVLLRNMEDPRLAAGVNLLTAIQGIIILLLFTGAYFYWDFASQCPVPKGVVASEQSD